MRENPLGVMAIMQRCLILRAEHYVMDDVIEYWAYSEMFDKLEDGYMVPEYKITVKEVIDNGYCFYDVKAER